MVLVVNNNHNNSTSYVSHTTVTSSHCYIITQCVLTIQSLHEVLECQKLGLNARLSKGVVVLYALEHLLHTPEAVCLNALECALGQLGEVIRLRIFITSCLKGDKETCSYQPHRQWSQYRAYYS